MKILQAIGLAVAAVIVVIAGFVVAARAGAFNKSYDSLVAEFATPPSYFMDLGRVRVHVRDEGSGPTILMLHSSMTNLRIWDAWADDLKRDHRVVRIDWPPYGLTVDNMGETGMQHAETIIAEVVDKLNLHDIVLVGSSSGATLAVLYAADHPDKVRAMALSTLPLKAPGATKTSSTVKFWNWAHATLFPGWYPSVYWRAFLKGLYGDPSKVTDAEVKLFTDTNNLQGGFARVNAYYRSNVKSVWSKGAGGYADKITVPILLQWGDKDPVLPPDRADQAVASFRNAKVTVIHYPQGHYPMLEDPAPTGRDLRTFIDSLPPAAPRAPVTQTP